MSTLINNTELREISLGRYVQGKTSTLSGAAVHQLFTVTGGEILVTALWGKCTTAMTGANTLNLQTDPTTGDTVVVATATDLGTTDTAAGTTIGITGTSLTPATNLVKGGQALTNLVVTTGEIESDVTGAGANGVVEWFCTYVPLTAGASVAASA
jgi:hypothetical protein